MVMVVVEEEKVLLELLLPQMETEVTEVTEVIAIL